MSETNLCDVKNTCRIVPKYSGTENGYDSTFTKEHTICSVCFPMFSSGITWSQTGLDKSLTTTKQRNKSLVTRHLKVSICLFVSIRYKGVSISDYILRTIYISLICDKSVTTQNLAFLSYWYRKKRLQMHF